MTKLKLLSASGKGKGLGVFLSSKYDDHEQTPMARFFWRGRFAVFALLVLFLSLAAAFPAEHILRYGWTHATQIWLSIYLQNFLSSFGLSVFAEIPDWAVRVILRTDIYTIFPMLAFAVYIIINNDNFKSLGPYGSDVFDKKSSRKANEKDIKKMGGKGASLFDGFMMVLGKFNKKYIKLTETLSALCVAPPGTGKTAGVVVPTIFECDTISMIVNDPKPEISRMTSGYRSTIGPVFVINWAGQDDPTRGIYYPSWNPLSPSHIPPDMSERELYVDSMCNVLIGETSKEVHWTLTGRAALSGFIHFMVSKIERARANDWFFSRLKSGEFDAEDAELLASYYSQISDINATAAITALRAGNLTDANYAHIGTWANIPPHWIGREASFSMIFDWINTSQLAIQAKVEERRRQGDQYVGMEDSMKDLFQGAVNEAKQFGYAHRAILELTQLANTPDRERGSILSTVFASLAVFRNAAVRARTSHSDFHFKDLRGMKDPKDGKIKPVTVYLSINQVDAGALNPITGIFVELMSNFLISNPPDLVKPDGKIGPCPVLFVLDEFPKMIKLNAVIEGPAVGRGQQVSYLLIGQDLEQIAAGYSREAAETLMSTTAAKIVLRQNSMKTAEAFSHMMGQKIEVGDDGKNKEPVPLYAPMDIITLSEKKEIVIIQGHANRPIEADLPRWFEDEGLRKKQAISPSGFLPDFLIEPHKKSAGV
ncbi:MAG: type IV secretory system conjugative DNA transfer family protein [Rickettsiales bacterium]|jgi:type IV secretory pathway TraG/TraD family ATPase VirD4|nr:type IV secretory system conjugative DNA transfer family protein [Rickettsiales bacterium]